MKISFLLHNAYGIGGTITTTFNLAQALAERHEVEILSVRRPSPPADVQRGRLAEDQPARGGRVVRVEAEGGETVEQVP